MLNIHKEIKMLVYENGTSLTKVLNGLRAEGINVPVQNNFASKCKRGTIRFDDIQHILDSLGYKLQIVEK